MGNSVQTSLFDTGALADQREVEAARARMRAMIDRLVGTEVAWWTDQMGPILDDGSFMRAMRLVPADEAQALWAEYDLQMVRVYAIYEKTLPPIE